MENTDLLASEIAKAVIEKDGRTTLSCPAAFRIAEKLDIEISAVGQYCNEQGIKMVKCQLGCF